jgi:hypothetical protein
LRNEARGDVREGDVVAEIQNLPTLAIAGECRDEGTDRPERVVRFSPPGHFGPSEVVDAGTFEVSADGFVTLLPILPPSDVAGVQCRYRSHGVLQLQAYTGGHAYVVAEPARVTTPG